MEREKDNTRSYTPISGGTEISHYKIIEKIGAGGMGEVYLADDTKLDRKVALKFLPWHLCQVVDSRARFKREARAAARLSHPNIVTIHEIGEFQERPYIVMQYIEGRSLEKIIADGPLKLNKAIEIALQICDGLNTAHDNGIVHRDIKPSNILFDGENRVKVLDFGLAALLGSESITRAGSTMGTISYMSPEQISGQKIDNRSDLFSFGVILYEMVAGTRPFTGENHAAIMHSITNKTPIPLNMIRPEIPGELQKIIDKSLSKNPKDRYQAADKLADILNELASQLHDSRGAAPKRSPSIAVLPFKDMSPQRDQEYFCDGIAEEIINALTNIENIDVAARTSAFSFKDRDTDIREIGRKLDIETILEGSVRKSGNRVRITAQLVKVTDGFHLWSDKYDRDMSDIFAIQDEISLAIVDQLKPRLLGGEKDKILRRYTENVEAYHLYLKGRYHWKKRTKNEFEKAIEKFRQAIDIDPAYAPAYVGLSDAYILTGVYCHRPADEVMRLAKEAVTHALDLDDGLAEAHASRAHIKMLFDWDWEGAEKEFRQSIELNPRYAPARLWYTLTLTSQGRLDEALTELEKARELDPLSLIINTDIGLTHYLSGRYNEAVEELRAALEIDTGLFVTHLILGFALIEMGNYEKAIESIEESMRLSGNSNLVYASLGYAYAVSGYRDKARTIIRDLESEAKKQYISSYSVALIYVGLREIDKAFEMLHRAVEERTLYLIHTPLKTDPKFEPLFSDSRFNEIMKSSGL